MNAAWHERHPLPRNAKLRERIAWHRAHQKHCACRPIPASLKAQMSAEAPEAEEAKSARLVHAAPIDPRFSRVVDALTGERQVTFGGKGFGSGGLKVGGKLFALWSPRAEFVVKLPKARVSELIAAGKGKHFDTGAGRLMKEWLVVSAPPARWVELAREALGFVRGG